MMVPSSTRFQRRSSSAHATRSLHRGENECTFFTFLYVFVFSGFHIFPALWLCDGCVVLRCFVLNCFEVSVTLTENAMETWVHVGKSSVPFSEKKTADAGDQKHVYISEFEVGQSSTGRANQKKFVQAMVRDFEQYHWKILRSNGMLKINKTLSVRYEELLMQVPGYLQKRYARNSSFWKAPASDKTLTFGALALKELQAFTPHAGDSNPGKFLKWLEQIHFEAPALSSI